MAIASENATKSLWDNECFSNYNISLIRSEFYLQKLCV
ncbi:hypothetical protein GXM_01000 [Nostoc sphaeroides CCNUC1]|uniref:Uncharacterized protein n=1 Tax=Nostoc sphaeroides CCNUC1 TaxID=2653204 RepID=A0A5P8VT33_9NOSO|nr:hypothetical protein GXM_01000 [Nostoc sphaeroides CCNUC1]